MKPTPLKFLAHLHSNATNSAIVPLCKRILPGLAWALVYHTPTHLTAFYRVNLLPSCEGPCGFKQAALLLCAGELSPGVAWALVAGLAALGISVCARNFGPTITKLYSLGMSLRSEMPVS